MEAMIKAWDNIPDNSIAVSAQGADQYSGTFTFKYTKWRSLTFTIPKIDSGYLYTRFQGDNDPWSNPSDWRKIPLLNNDNIIANNIKADNETRLQKNENDISSCRSVADNVKLMQDNHMSIYGTETYSTDTGSITSANITTGLTVNGTVSSDNVAYDNESRLKAVETSNAGKLSLVSFGDMNSMMSKWKNITTPAVLIVNDGPEEYTSTIIFKQNDARSLSFVMGKVERDYLWTKFQGYGSGNDWTNASDWRKIPLLKNDNIIANNIKEDNEMRLKALENNQHEPYDDTEIRREISVLENIKANTAHFHRIKDILDYEPLNETRLATIEEKLNFKENKYAYYTLTDIVDRQVEIVELQLEYKVTLEQIQSYTTPVIYYMDGHGNKIGWRNASVVQKADGWLVTYYMDNIRKTGVIESDTDSWRLVLIVNDTEEIYLGKVVATKTEVYYGPIASNYDQHLSLGNLLKLLYPIGSIYTSMNSTTPTLLFGFGEWQQITDRFLYCADTSMETGGSKKISVEQLPPHSHKINELDIRGNENGSNQYTIAKYGGNDTTINTSDTGGGEDYMPPYMTVYAWYRIA